MTPTSFPRALFASDGGRVLGVRLRPHCLGHELLLQKLGSPFAADSPEGAEPGLGDLVLALGVSARHPCDAARWLATWRARLWMRWMGWWWRRWPDLFIHQQCLVFQRRVNQAWAAPRVEPGGGEPMGSPLLALVRSVLMGALGKTEREALGTPLSLAWWEYLVAMETDGRLKVARSIQASELEMLKRTAAALAAGTIQIKRP